MALSIGKAVACGVLASTSMICSGGGYLFVHFRGEGDAMGEQIYFAVSRDGKTWEQLNAGKPILVSALGEKGVRDPHIIRSPKNDKFYLIATDLSIFHNRDWTRAQQRGSRAIIVWESTDLIKWSQPRRVEVAAPDAGCTWAPEAFYDKAKRDYLVYWASRTKGDNFAKQRIWAARTKDFAKFSKPFVYIEGPADVIDTTIVRDGKTYYRFSKDERRKAITMEKGDSLAGAWTMVDSFSLKNMTGYEGPTCYQLPNGSWRLLLDHYARGKGYEPFDVKEIRTGAFARARAKFATPYLLRHGTVMNITHAECDLLQKTFGGKNDR